MNSLLLLITNSEDGTATQLVAQGGLVSVFRLNVDLWRDYVVDIRPGRFRIEDPTKRSIENETCSAVLFRKPHYFGRESALPAERWAQSQVLGSVEHLVNWARETQRLALVDPLDERRVDKVYQLNVARKYFYVPDAALGWGRIPDVANGNLVAKSLVAAGFEGGRFLFTRRVDSINLDPGWPWLLQLEEQGFDLTVVYVDGQVFTSQLDRRHFEGQDWRRFISNKAPLPWENVELAGGEVHAIRGLMRDLRLRFGRLDFIRRVDGKLAFLEVNTNGEWGWLDDGQRGIAKAIWSSIETVAHSPKDASS